MLFSMGTIEMSTSLSLTNQRLDRFERSARGRDIALPANPYTAKLPDGIHPQYLAVDFSKVE
jgi:hypothetical protein